MFSIPNDSSIVYMPMTFSPWLVILSIVIACIGSFTALSCIVRIEQNSLINKKVWLILSTVSMTLSVWSMHFIGMAALKLPVYMSFNVFVTILSLLPLLITTFLAFYLMNRPRKRSSIHILAGTLMGIGFSSMHYLGVYAMEFHHVSYYYDTWIFGLSILVSIVVSIIVLYLFSAKQKYTLLLSSRIVTSCILAIAISSMHYLGMYAMKLYVKPTQASLYGATDDSGFIMLISAITVSMMLVLILLLSTVFMDRYIENRIHYFDPLTKLPNRSMFQERIEASSKVKAIAVWHFHDLETYNQEHGYFFVDQLIAYIAKLLQSYLPSLTNIYRTQGNRFTFVANDEAAASDLFEKLQTLTKQLKEGISFKGNDIQLQGICVFVQSENGHLETLENLYLNSLTVLKHPGINNKLDFVQYDSKIHTRNFADEILEGIDCAMVNHHLYLVYQPKINPITNTIESVEALIRWQHSKHGFLSPAIFLPILESNNRMGDLTDWVIEQVCKQLIVWKNVDNMPKQVAINIPGHYITSNRLMEFLTTTTAAYDISAKAIELEITETSFVKNIASAEKVVRDFRKAGFSVALDDFGTGASSLSYLKKIPINTLKIDKSFIDDVPMSMKDASIIKSMIQLGQSLNMKVVVEGVETKEQVDFLIDECGAPYIQGFYYAKPMKPEELAEWLHSRQLQVTAK